MYIIAKLWQISIRQTCGTQRSKTTHSMARKTWRAATFRSWFGLGQRALDLVAPPMREEETRTSSGSMVQLETIWASGQPTCCHRKMAKRIKLSLLAADISQFEKRYTRTSIYIREEIYEKHRSELNSS